MDLTQEHTHASALPSARTPFSVYPRLSSTFTSDLSVV